MKTRNILMAALAAIVMMAPSQADGKSPRAQKDGKGKTTLAEENRRLRAELDSLKAEYERFRQEVYVADSIAAYQDSTFEEFADTAASVLAPEDYTSEISDSLLNIWYTHRMVQNSDTEEYDMDSVKFKSNVPDEVYVERIKAMNSFITLPYNDIVKNYIILYSEKMPTKMSHILALCEYYMPIFQETFNKYDMPEELKAMAIIESAMNPLAVSRVGAKGMWQFMYGTAKRYGLHIDSFVDERLDPIKSVDAAARYLMDSYTIFGDWNLAIASYNCGAGNVNKAIRRSGGKREFWDIWPYLPRETRGYVPAFVGALYAMTYHKEHGIKPGKAALTHPVDTFKINKMLHLKQVSEVVGVPMDELKNLNPQYRHDIIPGNDREYLLRIPYTYTNAFIDHEDSVYTHKADIYFNPVTIKKIKDGGDGERIVYKVKNGDYLGKIATQYRVSVTQIKRWNNLKNNNIRVGQKLIIYRGGRAPATTQQTAKSPVKSTATTKKSSATPAASSNGSYTTYKVKSGDSFYSIAKNYPGVSAQNIMDYNGLNSSNIRPGMTIRIPITK